jgi:N-acetylglucosamine kinase-like BadF-type ATPase
MTSSEIVFGADGGGTKTLGVLADLSGNELAREQVGPGNPNVAGVNTAAQSLTTLVQTCCARAGCDIRDVRSMVFGLAGVGSHAVREKLANALRAQHVALGLAPMPVTLETDSRIGLEGAFDGGPGVVMIAGTGSMLIGKTPEGTIVSVGGWGRILGDEGSGYAIGLAALRAVAADIDGRGESTSLRQRIADTHGWGTRDRIIAAVYQEKFDIPSLAPLVLSCAEEGDGVAAGILASAAEAIAAQLDALIRRITGPEKVGVVFVGGLIDKDTTYARVLRQTIGRRVPRARIQPALHPPVWGAVLLAQGIARKLQP